MSKNRTKKPANPHTQDKRIMCFHVEDRLYTKFKVKVDRLDLKIRDVAAAMITAFVEGELVIEKETKNSSSQET